MTCPIHIFEMVTMAVEIMTEFNIDSISLDARVPENIHAAIFFPTLFCAVLRRPE